MWRSAVLVPGEGEPRPVREGDAPRLSPERDKDQTRRRLAGRTPLCGIGVTSRIEVMVKPTACSARSALSRPEPGPLHFDFEGAHAVFGGLAASVFCGNLRGIGRRLAAALEAHHAGDDQLIVLPWRR
jgi:hypothetical protein